VTVLPRAAGADDPAELRFGPFCFEPASERLWRGAEEIHLKPKMRDMLLFFVCNPGRLIAKAELLTAIWSETHVSPETLRSSLRELRNVLGDDARAPRFVETVHGRGYRFLCDVTEAAAAPAGAVSRQAPGFDPVETAVARGAVEGASHGTLHQVAATLRGLAEHPQARMLARTLEECASQLLEVISPAAVSSPTADAARTCAPRN